MLLTIAIAVVIVLLIAALLIFASTRPHAFRVERSIAITAAPERVFALVDDFHNWASWSPWEHLDPSMKKTYSGSPSGPGAVYEWQGNSKAGKGRMEITSSMVPSFVNIKLDFLKPFESHNTTSFSVARAAAGTTHVSWTMQGACPFIMKVMGIFVSMDKMIGKDFDKGLANLKSAAEAQS
jgi:Polyketide cyclase / dehydrase and lipid transport